MTPARDDGQKVVEVVRDPAGELADRLHFLGLDELGLCLREVLVGPLELLVEAAILHRHRPSRSPRVPRRRPPEPPPSRPGTARGTIQRGAGGGTRPVGSGPVRGSFAAAPPAGPDAS